MKYPLIIGNWKLNGNKNTITKLITDLNNMYSNVSKCNIAIAPPLVYLDIAHTLLLKSNIKLCAQNVDIHLSGSFTGETSSFMLKDLGVQYVLIGHSEQRIYHKDNNTSYIAEKFFITKSVGLIPILCIGENKTEYDSGSTQLVCSQQIDAIIKSLGIQSLKNSIIAYEPIWAIGSGTSANPNLIQSIHKFIRNYIAQYDISIANQLLIQYGGSVNSNNITQLIIQKDIDGVLIGAASLNINSFSDIIQSVLKYTEQ